MAKLTKRLIDSLEPVKKDTVLWDAELPGFGLRLWPSGRRVFVVQYRNAQGRTRKVTLGRYGILAPEEARRLAKQILVDVQKGKDPAEQRDADREAPTVAELAERFMAEHAETRQKPRSISENRRFLEQFILPALGGQRVDAVTRADLAKLHHTMRDTPYQANHVRALLSAMFNLAERWGLRPDGSNPVRHVEKFKEYKRERFLSSEELARLGQTLAEAEREGKESPGVIHALRLLTLTGCRRSEILTLKWEHVDFEHGLLRLPDSKTGAKTIPLAAPALEMLATIPRLMGNPHVILGHKTGAHLVNLNGPWQRLRTKAALPEVRIHDLRHSFASVGAAAGLGLPIIGKLLGHTQAQTTHRYAHLATDPLKAAADVIAGKIAEAMKAKPKVVNLKRNG
ncbi:MAG: site-specific integrase [Pseudomonadota bacterium]